MTMKYVQKSLNENVWVNTPFNGACNKEKHIVFSCNVSKVCDI